MNFTGKIKKLIAITLVGAMVFLSAKPFSVHAQDISKVTVSAPGYGIVTTSDGSGVNVRNAPNLTSSKIITSVPNKSMLMIVGQSGDFYRVQYDTAGHYPELFTEHLLESGCQTHDASL